MTEILIKYKRNSDPKDKNLLCLFRFLKLKFRINHTIKSNYKLSLQLKNELPIILDFFIIESAISYFNNKKCFNFL